MPKRSTQIDFGVTTPRGKKFRTLDEADPETGVFGLTLVEAAKRGVRAHEYIREQSRSPWENYEKCWDLRLGIKDWITVAERRVAQPNAVAVKSRSNDPLTKLVLVKRLEGPNFQEHVLKLQQVQHTNIVSALEIFRFDRNTYVVFEYMAYSISYVAGNPHLDEIRLAAILGQVSPQQQCLEQSH
jgi:hypothetical protein